MVKKLRVGVIFGGRSGEHEISVRSATTVIGALDARKYTVIPIAIDKKGKWLAARASRQLLSPPKTRSTNNALPQTAASALDSPATDGESVVLTGDSSHKSLITLRGIGEATFEARPLDVVFPILHGTYGEDGTIQGLLEMADLPYVGCGVLGAACGMDKIVMKILFGQAGLPLCRYAWFTRAEWEREESAVARRIGREIGYPCFVKPANLGSSVGISKARDRREFAKSVALAARYDRRIIVEEAVDAREIECAIMGNDEPEASLPGEYVVSDPRAQFLDYTEKYTKTGHVTFTVPAPLGANLTARIRKLAVAAFRAIDGAGLARVDFFLCKRTKQLYVNEINTMPGLTDVSGFPKMWDASGLAFSNVLDRLIELAYERHREKSRNSTNFER